MTTRMNQTRQRNRAGCASTYYSGRSGLRPCMHDDPQLDQALRRRMRYAERKLREAQRRLSRAERSILHWSGYLPTSGMSELAPSNIRYGRRKWTKRRTELRWGGI